jgi:hypothetical protein
MAKPKRSTTRKSRDELLTDLSEQIELLCAYCEAFDGGKAVMAKPMATALKVLLYGGQGKSQALLHQLGIRQRRFFDSAQPFRPGSRFAQCQLAALHVRSGDASYMPLLSDLPYALARTDFPDWWTSPVVRDNKNRTFSRLQIVQEVRDTDGGGHIDAELGEEYADFKSGRYMGWRLRTAAGNKHVADPHLACVRQIAHETLLTLKEAASEQFKTAYVYPEKPIQGKGGAILFGTEVQGPPGGTVPVLNIGIDGTELIGEV